jgi:macrolide transport system ATP-binding/permease protein
VEIPAVYAGVAPEERHGRARALLTQLGLAERISFRPKQLSGGQQQRVSIARALMNGGQIILADEPTGALDSKSGVEVMKLLDDLSAAGHTVILITHAAEVAAHARRVIEIKDGYIVTDPGPMPVEGHKPATSWTARHGAVTQLEEGLEAAKSAFRALRINILRSILTLLGIVIGVGSVITMLAIGDGAKQQVLDRISAMGSNLLTVRPGVANQRGFNNTSTLVLDDVTAIDEGIDNIVAAVPAQESNATLRFGENDTTAQIIGTSYKFPQARQWPVVQGTFFALEDEQQHEAVAVLGRTTADDLFPNGQDPLGQYVLIGNQSFQVIGVMARKGAAPNGQDQDEVVLVPYMTSQIRLSGNRYLNRATVAVTDVDKIKDTTAKIESLLAERHGTVDFRIMNAGQFLENEVASRQTMTMLLGSIAAISLLVGGIGVMNIMLVSVTERTREIGIRMATGARTRNILQQFLIEALVVSSVGGAIGVVLGLLAAVIVGSFGTPVAYSIFPVLLAFGSAFATGLIFGFLPARKAAYLDPVVALQSE